MTNEEKINELETLVANIEQAQNVALMFGIVFAIIVIKKLWNK